MKSLHFTTVLSVQHARSDERVATRRRKIGVLPQFWASDTHEMTRGLPPAVTKLAFYHSFERPTRPKWRKGRSASSTICVLPQFWTSDTSEVTKGSLGDVKNLPFTTVLNVRHARSDERVAPICEKFAFYHSFERPTRTKWREGCQIHRCDPCAPTEKEYILRLFQKILISSISLQSFL